MKFSHIHTFEIEDLGFGERRSLGINNNDRMSLITQSPNALPESLLNLFVVKQVIGDSNSIEISLKDNHSDAETQNINLSGAVTLEPSSSCFSGKKNSFQFKLHHRDYHNIILEEDVQLAFNSRLKDADLSSVASFLKSYAQKRLSFLTDEIPYLEGIISSSLEHDKPYYENQKLYCIEEKNILDKVLQSNSEDLTCHFEQSGYSTYFVIIPFQERDEIKNVITKIRGLCSWKK